MTFTDIFRATGNSINEVVICMHMLACGIARRIACASEIDRDTRLQHKTTWRWTENCKHVAALGAAWRFAAVNEVKLLSLQHYLFTQIENVELAGCFLVEDNRPREILLHNDVHFTMKVRFPFCASVLREIRFIIMHHVEDYIEVYGHIPVEVRDKLLEIQNIDQAVETFVNELDSKSILFFNNASEMDESQRDAEYRSICDDYNKALEYAESKIQIAEGVRDLLNRCFWDLCQKIARLKSELEDSCPGVTEKLERESLFCDELLEECSRKESEERFHKKRHKSRRKHSICLSASSDAKTPSKRPVTCLQSAPALPGPIKRPVFPIDNGDNSLPIK